MALISTTNGRDGKYPAEESEKDQELGWVEKLARGNVREDRGYRKEDYAERWT